MAWNLTSFLRRRFLKPARRKPIRRTYRPRLESLEDRITPTNVPVTSFHYDPSITGQNLQETTLTPQNVNATNFGLLANAQVDGYVYAQPLYMPNVMINGVAHNVLFVATEHDSVYAFDVKNDPSSPTGVTLTKLWQHSFISNHPADAIGPTTPGITTVPQPDVISTDIVPEIGITGAPVIDPTTGTLYVVAKTKEMRSDGAHYVQTLHALDITTGQDKYITSGNGGYIIGDSHTTTSTFANETTSIMVPGSGDETSGGANPMVPFSALRNDQRPSLQLLNGRVYVAWSSHGDNRPYHGWVVGFNETTLLPEEVFCDSPNAGGGGIWQSEGALSTDGTSLYFGEGNDFKVGNFSQEDPTVGNYSESVIKLTPNPTPPGTITQMTVSSYFTPYNWQTLDNNDADLGSGGVMLLPDSVGSTAHPHLMVETGKDGHIYLLDRDNLGGLSTTGSNSNIVQDVMAGPGGVWGNPAYYQLNANTGLLYYHGSGSDTRVFEITNGQIQQVSPGNYIFYRSNQTFGFPGAQPVISSNGADNPSSEIDWEIQSDNYGSQGIEELHAYALPANLTAPGNLTELYNSNMTGQRDQPGASVKFTSAIVTNGMVMLGTENSIDVYGLFPTHTAAPAAPTGLTGQGVSPTSIQLTWTLPPTNTATGIKIFRSTDGTNFTLVNTVAATATSYTDTGLNPAGMYYYKIAATNQVGDSPFSNTVQAAPTLQPPVLTVANATSVNVTLNWSAPPVANNHYSVQRSTDGTNFTTIATGLTTTTYTDSDPVLASTPGLYYYRVIGFTDAAGTRSATSNAVAVKVGPNSGVIDYSGGFPASPPDLQANGSAAFAETTARLTNAVNQTGSVFSTNEENILNWSTTFSVRLHEGTQPNYANGFAFVIQAVGANVVGQGTTGLGYQGIPNSLALTFDTYNGTGTGGGAVGLFADGDNPSGSVGTGEARINLDPTMVNLDSQSTKTITLSYAYNAANPSQSQLIETILDPDHGTTPEFTHTFMVDLPSLLGIPANGNTIGYVGFTGSTGSQNFWELQDILNWKFTPAGPAAPHNLTAVANAANTAVNLAWTSTSADDQGFYIERSTSATSGFTRIATVGAGVTTYTDSGLTNAKQYYYRVQAFNHSGTGGAEVDSGYSNVASANVVSIPYGSGFANHSNLTANTTPTRNVFSSQGTLQLTDGGGSEATSVFYNTLIGVGAFDTTFTLQDTQVSGAADGVSFVIQADPRGTGALGASGGAEGYGGTGDITNSIAIKFDQYTHGTHNPSTGLFTNGQSPDSSTAQDVSLSPINLDSGTANTPGDPLQVHLVYDGASTITETITDTVTHAVFSHTYTLPNGQTLGQLIGSNTAYVGFTAGTGGETSDQNILNWTGQFQTAPPQAAALQVSAPSTETAGQSVQVTVKVVDQNGNPFPGYTGTIHFTSSDPQAVLPANYTFTAADQGMHTFTVILKTAGSQTITAADTVKGSIMGSATVAVSPAAVSAFTVSGFPIAPAGTPEPFTVTAKDAYGNTVTGYTGTVHFTSSDPAATLPANYTFTAADQGTHTFMATLNTPGTQSITATDTTNSAITGTQSGITVLSSGALAINYPNGFSDHSGLTANGSATFVGDTNGGPLGIFTGHQNIGNATGTTTFSNTNGGTYTLTDNGGDIWNTSDNMQFVYETLTGDGSITARLVSANAPDFWNKMGVMIRNDLTPGSSNVIMLDTPNTGHQEPVMDWRDVANGASADTTNHGTSTTPNVPTPIWLRLVRTGNNFTGYWAADNNGTPGTWNLLLNEPNGHNTTMGSTVYVGLAIGNTNGEQISGTFDHVTVTGNTTPTTIAELTNGGGGEAGSIFTNNKVVDTTFSTTFTLKDLPVSGAADSLSFVLQNDPRGPTALGNGGGDGGYGYGTASGGNPALKIVNSIAVKFDLYTGGSHNPTTGLFINGQSPGTNDQNPPGSQDVPLTGINLGSGDPLQVTLIYNGTTLTETVKDTVTGATFSHDYLVNIPQLIGSTTAYAGFTAGTGGQTAIQDILNWTGQFPAPQQAPDHLRITGVPTSDTAGSPIQVTVTALDQNGHQIAYTGTVHFTSTDQQAVLPANYTFTAADNGSHTFTITPKTAGNETYTVTDTSNGLLTATASTTVTPAAASTLLVNGFPNPAAAGALDAFIVTAEDPYGNVATGYTGTVHLTSSDQAAVLPANYTFTTADHGQHAFATILNTLGTQSITATDVNTPSITGTQSGIVVTPASFQVTGLPSSVNAGDVNTITVSALDANGNVLPNFTGTVHFTSSDPQALLPADYTFTTADQGTQNFDVALFSAGTQTINVALTGVPGANVIGTASTFVSPQSAETLSVTGLPASVTAGSPATFTVTARDQYGNIDPNYTGTVTFSSTDPQAVLPADYTFTAADQGVHTFSATLGTAGAQSITATDVDNGFGGSAGTVVNAAAGSQAMATFPSEVTAGSPNAFTLTILDAYGNVATGYRGTVHFTSSDPQAVLPADYTFTGTDQGVHTFNVTLKTAGTQSITATDTTNPGITATQSGIQVDPAAATHLVVSGYPSPATAGTTAAVTVTAEDAYGNIDPNYAGTVQLGSNDPQATFDQNDYTFTPDDAGVHVFNVTLYTAGSNRSITAIDTATASIAGSQTGITITPASASQIAVSLPSSVTAGVSSTATVTIEDAYGNTVTGYTGTVSFSSSDGQAVLPANYTFTAADAGVHAFAVTFKTAGSQSLTATDTVNAGISGTGTTVVNPAAVAGFSVSGPSSVSSGTVNQYTVTAIDAYGNAVTNYTGTVHLSSDDTDAALPGDYTFTAADGGTHTFNVVFGSPGTYYLQATDVAKGYTGKQSGIVVQ